MERPTTKIKIFIFSTLAFAGAMFLDSCYFDNEEYLYGLNVCDTTDFTFSSRINPIIESSCFPCHTEATANGNVVLEGHANVFDNTGDGTLLCTINHNEGCEPMPKNRPKLSDCDINAITKWIENGRQDD
ncbi:MAG: hypothetical protein SH856_04205 [Flavobacteriales bacterium]|nr:hypothetical protein [Flavobacteriales bacterium]